MHHERLYAKIQQTGAHITKRSGKRHLKVTSKSSHYSSIEFVLYLFFHLHEMTVTIFIFVLTALSFYKEMVVTVYSQRRKSIYK